MRKIVLLAIAAIMTAPVAVMAQTIPMSFKIDKNALVKEVERSDKTLENEKRAIKGQTWLDRAEVFYKISAVVPTQIYGGMTLKDLTASIGKDHKTSEVTLPNGSKYLMVSIPEVDVYLIDDVVQFWNEKIVVYENAPGKAVEAFKKAAELDPKLAPKAKDGLMRMSDIYKMQAISQYNLGEYEAAANDYLNAFNVQIDPIVGVVDKDAIYNAGYIYLVNENYPKAIEIYEEAIANDVWENGDIAYYLSWAYLKTENQTDKAKDVLQRGFKLFPENDKIVEGLINYYYMTEGDFSEITDVLEAAIKKDPSKLIYWSGLGQAYLTKGDLDKTVEFYTKFVEQFPDEFAANYYLGDQLMEKGLKLLDDAEDNASLSKAQKDELRSEALGIFKKALPPLMKAYDEQPNEKAVVQRIKHVLFQLQDEPGMLELFDKFHKIEEGMN